jgi:hypothetical protein
MLRNVFKRGPRILQAVTECNFYNPMCAVCFDERRGSSHSNKRLVLLYGCVGLIWFSVMCNYTLRGESMRWEFSSMSGSSSDSESTHSSQCDSEYNYIPGYIRMNQMILVTKLEL